jgi:type II secretory pathway component GspD/PulD (secretin)
MNTRALGCRWSCLLAVGLAWLAAAGVIAAQDPPAQDKSKPAQDKPGAEERTIVFEMRVIPWSAALEWLSSTTGLPIIAGAQPTGTFSYIAPRAGRKYTLGEVIDIFNEGLAAKNYVLIRREKSILLTAADQPLDPVLVPRVSVAELSKRGNTEIVSVVISLKSLTADEFAPEVKRLLGAFGDVVVLSRANRLVVRDAAGNLRRMINIIQEVERPEIEAKKSPAAAGVLRTYQVPAGQAERLAKLVQEIFKNAPKVRVSALGANSVVVFAAPDDHLELARHLEENAARVNTELIQLSTLDARQTADTLRGMFGEPKAGGPFIDADAIRNALIVRGNAEQVQEVKGVLRILGEGAQPGNMRTLILERGGAGTMAEAIQHLLTQMRANPVKVILPTGAPPDVVRAEPPKKDPKLVKGEAPVIITAIANRLIVTSDDPQAVKLVAELFRLLQAPTGEGDFEVVRLRHAQAGDVARVLDEAFNTGRVGKGGFGGGPTIARNERIRVVADPATNSLLIKASPLDTLTIRNLLTRALDIPEARKAPDEPEAPQRFPSK